MTSPSKRPRDPNQLAKMMIDIASGEVEEAEKSVTEKRASKAGTVGGPARAASLTAEQRSDIAKVAASARWKKKS
jgi:hypothetical protein